MTTAVPFPPGPKDWRPQRPLKGSSLLTPEERERLERIERMWREDTGPFGTDILWACQQVRRLALLRPDEFDFPPYACLMNRENETAYALRYLRMEGMRKDTAIGPESPREGVVLLDRVQVGEPGEGVLAVRPYVRLPATAGNGTLEAFRKCTVSLTVVKEKGDRLDLLEGSALEEHLIGPDGTGVRRNPWSFVRVDDRRAFPAIGLDKEAKADPDVRYGTFFENKDHVMFRLDGRPEGLAEPVVLTAGIVAARYTTKAR